MTNLKICGTCDLHSCAGCVRIKCQVCSRVNRCSLTPKSSDSCYFYELDDKYIDGAKNVVKIGEKEPTVIGMLKGMWDKVCLEICKYYSECYLDDVRTVDELDELCEVCIIRKVIGE